MAQKRLTLMFDIDGTLIAEDGKLDPKVYPIFLGADLNKTTFIFSTSATLDQAIEALKQINQMRLDKGKTTEIHPIIFTSCGSVMYKYNTTNGKYEEKGKTSINHDTAAKYVKAVKTIDPKAIITYRCDEHNYIEKQKEHSFSDLKAKMYIRKEYKKGDFGLKFVIKPLDMINNDFLGNNNNNNKLQDIFIYSSKKENRNNIRREIIDIDNSYRCYDGEILQIPAKTKFEGIAGLYPTRISNYKFDKTFIYFGDGNNDVEMLAACQYSFARGAKASPNAIKAAKYHYDDLTEVAKALFCDKDDFDANMGNLKLSDMPDSPLYSKVAGKTF